MTVAELYKKAWNKWGEESQLKMLVEECAELIVAVSKYKRNSNGSTIEDIAEEIADVEICIEQVNLMLASNMLNMVETYRAMKMKRLQEILRRSKNE